ncbi:MAG TPA: hypothetical protein VLA29_02855 [Acidimicrobiia bacterium]|nr:hypothetical protein [Acidimicrobiia bacterium]
MTIEERIRDAMRGTASYEASPDLFAKVQRSIEEDQVHRQRVRRIVIATVVFAASIAAWLAAWWDPQPDAAPLPWWSIVAAAVAIEVAIVIVVGPAIRRFGRIYADDIFRTGPETGRRFLALLDVAYYLVFTGVVLISIPFDPEPTWSLSGGVAEVLQEEALRIGVLLLVMGMLHAITIFVLPFAGLVFASTRHRAVVRTPKTDWSPDVRRAHRLVTVVIVVAGAFLAIPILFLLLPLLLGFALTGG